MAVSGSATTASHATSTVLVTLFAMVVLSVPAVGATPEEQFQRAVTLLKEQQFEEAVPVLEAVLEAYPQNPAVLWNYGIATSEIGAHERAVSAWRRYRVSVPDDWRARAKLVQAFEALGRTKERDAERRTLLELRASGKNADLATTDRFCREQFLHDGQKFFVFEYFEPSGELRVFYAFTAVNEAGEETYRISLGSYDSTNEIAWELGDLPRSKRLYHLDRYDSQKHETLHFYEFQPDYELVRSDVLVRLRNQPRAK